MVILHKIDELRVWLDTYEAKMLKSMFGGIFLRWYAAIFLFFISQFFELDQT